MKFLNLMTETLNVLNGYGKTMDDVLFISGGSHEISKEDFVRIANSFVYDSGYGHQYVPGDLKLVGDGWWLERGEYDGSEWWDYVEPPSRPLSMIPLNEIDGESYNDLKYLWAPARQNYIGFSHRYSKLHGQTSGRLLLAEKTRIDENTPAETVEYDTDGKFPLPPGDYLMLVFLGDKGIPFTTYRTFTDEHIYRFCDNIGMVFAFNFKSQTEKAENKNQQDK